MRANYIGGSGRFSGMRDVDAAKTRVKHVQGWTRIKIELTFWQNYTNNWFGSVKRITVAVFLEMLA